MAALVAAALVPSGLAAAASASWTARAKTICAAHLRAYDGTDVFALSPNEVLRLARALDITGVRLRADLPGSTLTATRRVRVALQRSGRLGRIYSRAYRADPSDNSLPQEAAFENSLLDLRRIARHAGLRACSVKLATP